MGEEKTSVVLLDEIDWDEVFNFFGEAVTAMLKNRDHLVRTFPDQGAPFEVVMATALTELLKDRLEKDGFGGRYNSSD
jgi:hypothetical protein